MAARPIMALAAFIFTAGALLLMLFLMLAGAINHAPVNNWYFLQVDTGNIPNAPSESRWTFWNICPAINGRSHCGDVHPAFPLDPPSHRNFGTDKNIPHQFIGTSKYFYLTRFMFAFALIALFFAACAFVIGILALCTRIAARLGGFFAVLALFFQTLMCCLMTSAYVIGRDNFRSNGQTASIGKYAFGFEWAAWACLLITTVLLCVGGKGNKADPTTYNANRRSFFGGGRTKSTKSRGSRSSGQFDASKEYNV